ncbi:protein involved in sex pheromone biosynthesis [Salsuginibacillus halophilus]|uniref:Protein involved in sex pheromone biosynthesis n=1 Tax=Salsuginibacillus halophilus TaxID=517424 RepID=A0A2P8HLF8_9BACI|nr:CamS family sex pheromone protein [Salsuginibacillus halophilus]PSL47055.1 protein involved in sex pheromone biosynthesis [Salsuginibacillus halophilus]
MKKRWLLAGVPLLFLSGCLDFLEEDEEAVELEEEEEETEEQDVELSPEIPALDNEYRTVLQDGQYIHGNARGFSTAVMNNRMDLERLETGLMEVASEEYSPETYYFREGQYIEREELNSWLVRQTDEEDDGDPSTDVEGLNPALGEGEDFEEQQRSSPRVLSHIMEHNYVVENDEGALQLGGVVIGLSMNEAYYFREQLDDGTFGPWYEEEIPEEVSIEQGQEIAEEVLERLRNEAREEGKLDKVPVTFAIYRESPRDAAVPGSFLATATAPPEADIGSWETKNEAYYLFPSSETEAENIGDSDRFSEFKDEVNEFFEDYVGVTGVGRYQNETLQEMTKEIPIRFHSKTEVMSFAQYVVNLLDRYPQEVDIEVEITSDDGTEALIIKEPNEEAEMHVLR